MRRLGRLFKKLSASACFKFYKIVIINLPNKSRVVPAKRMALPVAVVVATFFSKGAMGVGGAGGLATMLAWGAVDASVISIGVGCTGVNAVDDKLDVLIISELEADGKIFCTLVSVDDAGVGIISKIIGKVVVAMTGVEDTATGRVDEAVELAISAVGGK